jgi:hypothetical protein
MALRGELSRTGFMGRPEYADVQWLQWLRQIGLLSAFWQGQLSDVWPFFGSPSTWHARSIMNRCIQVPAAYWPQIVDEECQKLLAAGIHGETVKSVRHWLERELTISP